MIDDELLDKKLTYHDFCDIISDSWLAAEETTTIYPDAKFRRELFQELENRVKAKYEL